MKLSLTALAALSTLAATEASAQYTDLTGRYRCVQLCRDGAPMPAFVTQNGRDLNLVNEAGEPSRAWIDWVGHIWAEELAAGRDLFARRHGDPVRPRHGLAARASASCRSAAASAGARAVQARRFRAAAERVALARDAYDGSWSVVINTQSGSCDPQYRFGVQIIDGNIVYEGGGGGNAQGRVGPNGGVWVNVSAAGNSAAGEGRLSRETGAGTWRGQGPGGTCAGTWQAARRG